MIRRNWFVSSLVVLFAATAAFAGPADVVKDRLAKEIDSNTVAADKVKSFIKEKLLPHCTNPVIVAAVKAQNAKNLSADEIKKTEDAWVTAEAELPVQTELLGNECAKEIKKISAENSAFGKTFVTDAQFATVGLNELTTNYYHASKAKIKDCYKSGEGALYVSKVQLDKSTNVPLQQVSLPVVDENGKAIGVICWGVKADKM